MTDHQRTGEQTVKKDDHVALDTVEQLIAAEEEGANGLPESARWILMDRLDNIRLQLGLARPWFDLPARIALRLPGSGNQAEPSHSDATSRSAAKESSSQSDNSLTPRTALRVEHQPITVEMIEAELVAVNSKALHGAAFGLYQIAVAVKNCMKDGRLVFVESQSSPSRVEQIEQARERDLVTIAAEFVRYWTTDRTPDGCGMCGGIPHSTTCYVGRMDALISAITEEGRQQPLPDPLVIRPQEDKKDDHKQL